MSSSYTAHNDNQAGINVVWQAIGGEYVVFRAEWARRLGSIPAALVLERLLFVGRYHADADGWFACTTDEMESATTLDRRSYAKARTILTDAGLIEALVRDVPPRVHIRIDAKALLRWTLPAQSIVRICTDVCADRHNCLCGSAQSSSNKDSTNTSKDFDPDASASAPKRSSTGKTWFPEGWVPDESEFAWAVSQGLTEEEAVAEFEQFRDHAVTNGRRQIDWNLSWRNWVRQAVKYKIARGGKSRRSAKSDNMMTAAEREVAGGKSWSDYDNDGVIVIPDVQP